MFFDVHYPHLRLGAVAGHVRSLSIELQKRGHEVIVCAVGHRPEFGYGIKGYVLEGFFQKIPFIYKDTASKWHPPMADFLITKELKKIITQEKVQIVHTHGRALYSALPLRKGIGVPLVASLHGYEFICPKADLLRQDNTLCNKPLTNECISCSISCYGHTKAILAYLATKINRKNLSVVDKFIAVSFSTKTIYQPYLGVAESRIVVIPNFYSTDIKEAVKMSGSLPEDFILFVGNLNPFKGVDMLIEAYNRLDVKTKLVLIGTRHPDYHYKGTDKIVLMENVPYELLIEAYQNCRFAMFPSIRLETFGVVTLEAMAQKKAVIASRSGGLSEVVADKETGLLVPPGDIEALSQAIKYLLENPDIASRMGQKGYERWQHYFTTEATISEFEKIYKSLIRDDSLRF
jgi:glycosyltransferase involved in cell wall biosynthesis